MRSLCLLFLSLLGTCVCAQNTTLELFDTFTDHAVLQRDADHPLWGWAKPKQRVTVEFAGQRYRTRAGADGRFEVTLPPTPAGGPHELSVKAGRETVRLRDLYFGDVYLLSGQSNMEWRLSQSDPSGDRARAIADPLIREITVNKTYDGRPRTRLSINESWGAGWRPGTAENIQEFSGVGSYFAHHLREEVDVPIGLIHSSWGGSRIEPWIRAATLKEYGFDGPPVDEDILETAGVEGRKTFARQFPGRELPTEDAAANRGWLADEVDDSAWPTMPLPTFWEPQGYANVDGVFYFRRSFDLTPAQAAGAATLYLGAIDDGDVTYINGQQVGTYPNAYSTERVYAIEPGVLRAGTNSLAIRVYDGQGGGGFSADPAGMRLETAAGNVPLAGDYRFNIGEFRVGGNYNQIPVVLNNAMIAPLAGTPLTGVLWYQGESNAGRGDNVKYAELMKGLIADWRDFFADADLPFYWVQLANYTAPPTSPDEPGWAVIRQSQTAATTLPRTGQAVITDIGEADDIHPKNKWEVGRRLSLHALQDIYGKDVQASSPVATEARQTGRSLTVRFAETGAGLTVREAVNTRFPYLVQELAVADAAGNWQWVAGELEADGQSLRVLLPPGLKARKLRYAWSSNPERANLFSRAGLPVTPFELSVE